MTLKEIAAELNVSQSVVSRVVNGYSKNFSVSDQLRERILNKVEECGYRANPVFRNLSARNNRHIAFMFLGRSVHGAGQTEILAFDRIGKILEKNHFDFSYMFCQLPRGAKFSLPHWKVAQVIFAEATGPDQFDLFEAGHIPYIVMNGRAGKNSCSINSDEHGNTLRIMEQLCAMGHRRIGYLNCFDEPHPHYSVLEREQTFRDFCIEKELPLLDGWQRSAAPVEGRLAAMLKQGATAVVTYDDVIGRQVLYAAWKLNVRIPEQLSVITFNDSPALDYTIPPLAGFRIPAQRMGDLAAEIAMKRMTDKEYMNGQEIRLSGELVLRDSVASAPVMHR